MKKVLVKILLYLFALCITTTAVFAFPLDVNAEERVAVSSNDEYIYYTDLFYEYPTYLANNHYFDSYVGDTLNLYQTVYFNYEKSAALYGTGFEYALQTITSPKAMISLITEGLSLHSNTYNEALDTANQLFVQNLFDQNALTTINDQYSETNSFVSRVKNSVELFNMLKLESTDGYVKYTAEYYLQESFDYLWDEGILSFISEQQVAQLWTEINAEGFEINKYLNLASTEIELAQAFVSALIMADVKIELIDAIIETQTTDTVLKQGMIRLKNQISGGFVTYFIDNYVVNKAIDTIFSAIIKLAANNPYYKAYELASAVVNVVRAVVFDWIWQVPSYNTVLAFQVLWSYSLDLVNVMKAKANEFAQGPFVSNKIIEYEDLFASYEAINRSAIELLESIAGQETINDGLKIYALFNNALNQKIETVTIKDNTGEIQMKSDSTQAAVASMLRERLLAGVKYITVYNGIESKTFHIKANELYNMWLYSIDGTSSAESMYLYKSTYSSNNIYGEYINSAKNEILQIPNEQRVKIDKTDWTYAFDLSLELRKQSDTVERNCIYAVNGSILGNIEVCRELINREKQSISIDGNFTIRTHSTFNNFGALTVSKDFVLEYWGIFNNSGEVVVSNLFSTLGGQCQINNNGVLRVKDFQSDDNLVRYNFSDSSKLYISGNYSSKHGHLILGQVIFDGILQQTVQGLNANTIIVDNLSSEGVLFLTTVSARFLFNHKGNKFSLENGGTFVDYDGDGLKDNIDPYPTCVKHVWDNGEIVKQPTYTEVGEKLYSCSFCYATKSEEIPMLCMHEYGEWSEIAPATCIENGEKYRICLKCSDCEYGVIEAFGHNNEPPVVVDKVDVAYVKNEANCTNPAIYYKSCGVCGQKSSDTFEYGTPIEHVFTKQVITNDYKKTNATTTSKAQYYYCCENCNEKGTETFEYGELLSYGDVNGDMIIDLRDIILLRKYLANYDYGTNTSHIEVTSGADTNADGKINTLDVVLLRWYLVNQM